MKYFCIAAILLMGSVNSLASESYKKIRLLDVISEPEGGLERQVFLYIDSESEIVRLDVEINEKVMVSASGEEIAKNKIPMVDSPAFESVMMTCDPCSKVRKDINLRYLLNGATGIYRTKTLRLVKNEQGWIARDLTTNVAVNKLTFKSNKVLGVLLGVEEIQVNPN